VHYRGGPESSFVILTSYLSDLLNHIDSYHKLEKQYVLNLDQLIPQQIHSLLASFINQNFKQLFSAKLTSNFFSLLLLLSIG